MKKETAAEKLNRLLGITEKIAAVQTRVTGKLVGVTEDQIQTFREAQGLVYFLQAPKLFTPKVCPHCGEGFMVSRQFVGYCSYTCIRKSLEELGIRWSKDGQYELLAEDDQVWNGNEPIWIRQSTLASLKEMVSTLEKRMNLPLSKVASQSHPDTSLSSSEITPPSDSSLTDSTNTTSSTEPGMITSPTNVTRPKPTFS